MHVPARNHKREPICPVCEVLVGQVGEFCSRRCYAHFLVAVTHQSGIVSMENLLTLEEQPWYSEDHGLNPEAA